MSTDYLGLQNTAKSLIENFGSTIPIKKISAETYNTITGEVATTETTSTIYAVKINYNRNEINDTSILIDDIKLYIAGDTKIEQTDKLVIEGNEYNIINITEIKPANTVVYYEVQVRK